MSHLVSLFPSEIYVAPLNRSRAHSQKLNLELKKDAYRIKEQDKVGQKWSKENYPHGYTSYSSLAELFRISSTFYKTDCPERIAG